jgi:hypothetical protein
MSQYWIRRVGLSGWVPSKRVENAHYLDGFVPRTGGKNATLGRLEPFDDLDRRVVLRDLLRLTSLDVVKTRSIVTTTRNNLVPFLRSVARKNTDLIFRDMGAYFIPTN